MSDLLKHLARNLVMGIVAGWISLAFLLATNTSGLLDLVVGSSNPMLPFFLLVFGFTLTFGSLSMGASIMMLPYGEDDGKDKGVKVHTLLASLLSRLPQSRAGRALAPIPVEDKTRRVRSPR